MPDGAFVIDLSPMRQVTADPDTLIITAQPGVLLGELDAAQEHGLVVPAGTVSNTGPAGGHRAARHTGGRAWPPRLHPAAGLER